MNKQETIKDSIKRIELQIMNINNLMENDFNKIMKQKNKDGYIPIVSINNRLEEINFYLEILKKEVLK